VIVKVKRKLTYLTIMRAKNQSEKGTWKRIITKGVSGVVMVEAVAFLSCFIFYVKINRDLDFRYTLHSNPRLSWILNSYYKFGETLSPDYTARAVDKEIWKRQGKDV